METINIQLKRLTTEPDSTPPRPEQSETPSTSPDQYYELLSDAPDNYFEQPTPQNQPQIDLISETQNKTITVESQPSNSSCNEQKRPFLDDDLNEHIQFDKERNLSHLTKSTSLTPKRKRHMHYMPMDFEKITLDGLIDTGALRSAFSEQDLNKIKLLANDAIRETGPPPNFQIMVANGQ